ncbi:DNA-directed RNA polymerase III subunit C1 (rpo31) [Lithohypha guttulata]|nr:DNA-directed RNA polymerase III subunit C1 (rpo31) [Lithohypha guttulata]
MATEGSEVKLSTKQQVVDDTPKVIKGLQFGVLSNHDIVNQSQVELADRRMYNLDEGRNVAVYGPLDPRMGISDKRGKCDSCGQQLQNCNGHFGHVKLVLPCFHTCSCILLTEQDRRKFLTNLKRAEGDTLRQASIVRKVADQAKKTKDCPQCGSTNGLVKKAGTSSLKIVHDKFKSFNSSASTKRIPPPEKIVFDASMESAKKANNEVGRNLSKAMDDLTPLRTWKLLRRITDADCPLLGLRTGRPESFLWRYIPAPPVAIRPSVGQEGATTEDDITAKLGDIVFANQQLREALKKGAPVQSVIEHWDYLSLQLAMYINSDVPGLNKGEMGKSIRGFVQRLKGKQGRFRGNLSGKRVDFSGRTVISPDPNLSIDEVAVPELVARNMTYPEVVNRHNKTKLQQRVRNGTKKWPGANYVEKKKDEIKMYLKFGNRDYIAKNLEEGDVVERHLEDGDIVLFNRQPSLHKLSILCHHVKVRPHRTFRLNECVCNPYNADFDGDEMNLHVPQTEEARAEALQLMGVKHNLTTPKNGEPIISAIQDFITAAYLLSSLDNFYDRKTFTTICMGMLDKDTKFELPPPTVIKPQALWTGKQVFNVLIRPNKQLNVLLNLDAPSRDHKKYHKDLHRDLQDDSFLCIRNSEVMCGRMDKSTVGSGKKNSLFYILVRDFGVEAATRAMNRLSKLCARWLGNQGFSVGISDVTPPEMLQKVKDDTITKIFSDCVGFEKSSKAGKLKRKPGLDHAQTLEAEQVRALSTVRTDIASILTSKLSKRNSPMVMATSGSKGSTVNVAQMAALLGQQDIEGKRVQNGFQDRTLPHFPKHGSSPPSRGFVENSFFSGLTPYEFIFHGMGGRVGLVDTAVKTAETGYMSRRLMKSLEDLSTQYDRTVRNSASNIVQFRFGDDELDPVDMEASAKPVDFERTYVHVEATTFNTEDKGLSDVAIFDNMDKILSVKRKTLSRIDFKGKDLPYDTSEDSLADQNESARDFVKSIQQFIMGKSDMFQKARSEKKPWATASDDVDVPTGSKRTRGGKASAGSANKKQKTGAGATAKMALVRASPSTKDRFELTSKLSAKTLDSFVRLCLEKYERAKVEPGHAVGAVGAQSIGEPGTQMTLKTFHFAGVAGMSLTAGVPRIKEIINASKDISTPVITCRLERRSDGSIPEELARIVKGRIECLYLEDITEFITISHPTSKASCIYLKLNMDTIIDFGLDITIHDVVRAIEKHRRFAKTGLSCVMVRPDEIRISSGNTIKSTKRGAAAKAEESAPHENLLRLQAIRRILPSVHVLGHPNAARAVVMAEDDPMSEEILARRKAMKVTAIPASVSETRAHSPTMDLDPPIKQEGGAQPDLDQPPIKAEITTSAPIPKDTPPAKTIQMHKLMISGYGLRSVLTTPGVNPATTQTNSIVETLNVLGIEAARSKIITEIAEVMKDLNIDPRHMALLADVMTYKGEVLGITRFGLAKMRDSVLQLASFEKTADHVFDAGVAGKRDDIEGVSECVIVGKTMGVGTGSVEVVRPLGVKVEDVQERRAVFEDAWNEA